MSSAFFGKTGGCVLQGFNFIKMLVHHRLFSQKNTRHFPLFVLFKTVGFQCIFQKKPVGSFLYSKVTAWTLHICNYTERNSIIKVYLRNFQTFAINYFPLNLHLCWRRKLHERLHDSWVLSHWKVTTHPFRTSFSLISNIC